MNQSPDELERQLTAQLRRVAAPPELAEHLMRATAARPLALRPWVGGLAAGLVLTGMLAGAGVARQRDAERARLRAERDFARSVEITDRALEPIRQRLHAAGVPLDE